MNPTTPILATELKTLDPAPEAALSADDERLSEQLLLLVMVLDDALPRQHRRRRLVLGTTGILSAAAVAAVLMLSLGAPAPAPVSNFALSATGALGSYTSTPVAVPPSTADRNACGTASSEHGNTSEEAVLTSEQRGAFRAMLFADGGGQTAFCVIAEDDALWISNAEYLSTAPAEDLHLEPAPVADQITTDLGRMDSPSPEFGIITSMSGRAGNDVESVKLTLGDGRMVDATVNNGHWAAWWPTTLDGVSSQPDFPTTTTFTTGDGAAHTAPPLG
ncbi:hypothetical protein [Subtercola boreus]|nr:hypothetical protein [Subtercola boreus]